MTKCDRLEVSLHGAAAVLNAAVPENTIREAMPDAFRVALRILESWGLGHAEMAKVLGLESRTLSRYKSKGLPERSIASDLVERTSYILGIEKALEILLGGEPGDEAAAIRRWIDRPSSAPLFADRPPRERITSGRVADLFQVRQYLDGWRGGDFA